MSAHFTHESFPHTADHQDTSNSTLETLQPQSLHPPTSVLRPSKLSPEPSNLSPETLQPQVLEPVPFIALSPL